MNDVINVRLCLQSWLYYVALLGGRIKRCTRPSVRRLSVPCLRFPQNRKAVETSV